MTVQTSAHEMNFDCLVGPTHHFGGLSLGNLASAKNRARLANPKRAALQGLEKMRYLKERGFLQGILPPHERPHMKSFRNLGFHGADEKILHEVHQKFPHVMSSLCSSSAMWAANAATVSPRTDSDDHKTHISPANLVAMLHRSIEASFAFTVFQKIFSSSEFFAVHPPLIAHDVFSDEGAANHTRLCKSHGSRGLQIFVYGKEAESLTQKTKKFPARQSKLANLALAQRHKLKPDAILNLEQNSEAIDKGAFHNDVVAVGNQNVFLCHELAYVDQAKTMALIRQAYQTLFKEEPVIIEIGNKDLPIEDAVTSYLFNSQLLTKPDGNMLLFAPAESQTNVHARAAIDKIISGNNPIDEVSFFNVSESMANGGGPACLRLRVVINNDELQHLGGRVVFTDDIYEELSRIVHAYYVDELTVGHFFDRGFLHNCHRALDEIATTLGLDGIYDFQR